MSFSPTWCSHFSLYFIRHKQAARLIMTSPTALYSENFQVLKATLWIRFFIDSFSAKLSPNFPQSTSIKVECIDFSLSTTKKSFKESIRKCILSSTSTLYCLSKCQQSCSAEPTFVCWRKRRKSMDFHGCPEPHSVELRWTIISWLYRVFYTVWARKRERESR